jgi:hypothetical protein
LIAQAPAHMQELLRKRFLSRKRFFSCKRFLSRTRFLARKRFLSRSCSSKSKGIGKRSKSKGLLLAQQEQICGANLTLEFGTDSPKTVCPKRHAVDAAPDKDSKRVKSGAAISAQQGDHAMPPRWDTQPTLLRFGVVMSARVKSGAAVSAEQGGPCNPLQRETQPTLDQFGVVTPEAGSGFTDPSESGSPPSIEESSRTTFQVLSERPLEAQATSSSKA